MGAALVNLAKLAHEMQPDDVSLSLDLPAGTLSFPGLQARKGSAMTYDAEEREQLEAAIEQRQRQIDKANTLALCEERERALEVEKRGAKPWIKEGDVDCTPTTNHTIVTKSAPTQGTSDMSQPFTPAEVALLEASMHAVAVTLKEMRAEFKAELEREVLKLRAEFLERELDRERGVKRPLRVVSPADVSSAIG